MGKKICDVLAGIFLLFLAALAAILILPKCFGCISLAVLSGSMEPAIPVGAIVFVKETEPEALQVGDVITYQMESGTKVTHRITEILEDNQAVRTKGDANEVEDGNVVSYADILGKMLFQVPYLGYISIYGKTPQGVLIACGVLIFLILLLFLPEVLKKEPL